MFFHHTFNTDFHVHKVIHFYISHFLFFYIFLTWNRKSKPLTSKMLLALYRSVAIEIEGELLTDNCVCTFGTAFFGVYTLYLPFISMVLQRARYSQGNLCFTQFGTRINWRRSLTVSDLFTMFTESINCHCRCLKNVIHQIDRNEWLLLSAFQHGLRQNLS